MPRGGARIRAGRKKDNDLDLLRKIIDTKITLDKWYFIIDRLLVEVDRGGRAGVRAAELLWRYRFGIPGAAPANLNVTVLPGAAPVPDDDSDAPALPASTGARDES